jgi:hypothetical protein
LQCTSAKKRVQQTTITKPFDLSNATTVTFSVKTSHEVDFGDQYALDYLQAIISGTARISILHRIISDDFPLLT